MTSRSSGARCDQTGHKEVHSKNKGGEIALEAKTENITKDAAEKRFVVLSEAEIGKLLQKAARIGAKAALSKYETETKEARHRKLHNATLLLRNYRMLQENVENAVEDISQCEDDMQMNEILALMMNRETNDHLALQSIKKSKARTALILRHIDTMLDIYQSYCEKSPDKLDTRRYEMLMDRYIRDEEYSVSEIASQYSVSEETVYRDISIAKTKVAALIFGVDGLNFR